MKAPPPPAASATALPGYTALGDNRLLVTGASGLIGSHLLGLLAGRTEIVAVSRFPQPPDERVSWLVEDLSRPGATTAMVDSVRPEIVVHLAGSVRGDRSLEAVGPTLRTNLVTTVELLEATTRVGCRRVVLSGSLLEEPASGGTQAIPPSPYGASRWAASAYARMFHALFETPVVILRPSYAYGPRQEPSKLIPHVIRTLLAGENASLSSGERRIDCVYAGDVAGAYSAAATAPGIGGETIDIGSGELTPVREIVGSIARYIGPAGGRPQFGELPTRALEQQVEVDVEQAAQRLGWRATTSLDAGIAATVDWFREQSERPSRSPGPRKA